MASCDPSKALRAEIELLSSRPDSRNLLPPDGAQLHDLERLQDSVGGRDLATFAAVPVADRYRMHATATMLQEPPDTEAPVLVVCDTPRDHSSLQSDTDWLKWWVGQLADAEHRGRFGGIGVAAIRWGRLPSLSSVVEPFGDAPHHEEALRCLLAKTLDSLDHRNVVLWAHSGERTSLDLLDRALERLGNKSNKRLQALVREDRAWLPGRPLHRLNAGITRSGMEELRQIRHIGLAIADLARCNRALWAVTVPHRDSPDNVWPNEVRIDPNLLRRLNLVKPEAEGVGSVGPGFTGADSVFIGVFGASMEASDVRNTVQKLQLDLLEDPRIGSLAVVALRLHDSIIGSSGLEPALKCPCRTASGRQPKRRICRARSTFQPALPRFFPRASSYRAWRSVEP